MKIKTVVTHNGNFHADDVFSIAALKCLFTNLSLIRTRDLSVIRKADIVVDVGGEYTAETDRFDHHQRGGAGQRDNGVPYSSFGLIWKKYGLELCNNNQVLAEMVDGDLVSSIDAIDCGYVDGIYEGVSLSRTISMFNPTWSESSDFDKYFDEAVIFASKILSRCIQQAESQLLAKDIVVNAISKAENPALIVLKHYAPWKQAVHELAKDALFILYPSATGQWRIQTIPVVPGSFDDRKALPKTWAGLSDDALQKVTGVNDAMFCHNGLFIAGAKSFEGAMKMAEIALNNVCD
jgi:uncharacterized UPF0160 family protein